MDLAPHDTTVVTPIEVPHGLEFRETPTGNQSFLKKVKTPSMSEAKLDRPPLLVGIQVDQKAEQVKQIYSMLNDYLFQLKSFFSKPTEKINTEEI